MSDPFITNEAHKAAVNAIHESLTELVQGQLSATEADQIANYATSAAMSMSRLFRLQPSTEPKSLGLSEYQHGALKTAIYPNPKTFGGLSYVAMGLASEAGEILGKVKKIYRDSDGVVTATHRAALIMELGDVLWYTALLAHELGTDLQWVAEVNLDKLQNRKDKGTLKGSGDER